MEPTEPTIVADPATLQDESTLHPHIPLLYLFGNYFAAY